MKIACTGMILSVMMTICFTASTFAQSAPKVSEVSMQRTACFGRCPEYNVELTLSGKLTYTGLRHTDRTGTYVAELPAKVMTKFFREISRYKLSVLKPSYKMISTDLPGMHLDFIISGRQKSIRQAESGPAYLSVIGKKIDSLVAVANWKQAESSEDTSGEGPQLNLLVDEDANVYTMVEQTAEFPGGEAALMKYLASNIRYPQLAIESNVQGKVICNFVIREDGSVDQVKVMRGIGYGCDEEAIRVIKSMPKWKPARQNGKAVKYRANVPISFKLK
jgi:TonB family protein